ncbi:EF-hand domain-containing protein [Aurantiacibacter suaedae]|uniref:EF-hand domain-containing protein n=1 Tax=Aurantiacibacter suaedae TaxID=2545755 RepID=UPI0010F83789|nr:EF-hand domain-containing protein [Aurantiacibacter suaedae]
MKTFPISLAIVATAAALAGTAAMAQDRGAQRTPQTRAQAEARATAMFDRLDVNADDQLSPADREAAERKRFDEADTDGNGQLSFAEVTAQREKRQQARTERREQRSERMAARGGEARGARQRAGMRMMRGEGGFGGRMLQRADTDGSGAVSRAEFTAAALARFDAADSNGDGTISAEERRAARADRRGMGRSPMPTERPASR